MLSLYLLHCVLFYRSLGLELRLTIVGNKTLFSLPNFFPCFCEALYQCFWCGVLPRWLKVEPKVAKRQELAVFIAERLSVRKKLCTGAHIDRLIDSTRIIICSPIPNTTGELPPLDCDACVVGETDAMLFVLQQLNPEDEDKHGKLKCKGNTRRCELCFFQEKHRRLSKGGTRVLSGQLCYAQLCGQEGVRPKGRKVGSIRNKNIHNLKKKKRFKHVLSFYKYALYI